MQLNLLFMRGNSINILFGGRVLKWNLKFIIEGFSMLIPLVWVNKRIK